MDTPKRSKLEVATDKVVSTLAKLNPDDLDLIAKALWKKKPRTAEHLLQALENADPKKDPV